MATQSTACSLLYITSQLLRNDFLFRICALVNSERDIYVSSKGADVPPLSLLTQRRATTLRGAISPLLVKSFG